MITLLMYWMYSTTNNKGELDGLVFIGTVLLDMLGMCITLDVLMRLVN